MVTVVRMEVEVRQGYQGGSRGATFQTGLADIKSGGNGNVECERRRLRLYERRDTEDGICPFIILLVSPLC